MHRSAGDDTKIAHRTRRWMSHALRWWPHWVADDRCLQPDAVPGYHGYRLQAADTVILAVGIDQSQEREGMDRVITTLPGLQTQLVAEVLALKKKTIVVLFSGGAMSLGKVKQAAPAIIASNYGGEKAATALADVLFGVCVVLSDCVSSKKLARLNSRRHRLSPAFGGLAALRWSRTSESLTHRVPSAPPPRAAGEWGYCCDGHCAKRADRCPRGFLYFPVVCGACSPPPPSFLPIVSRQIQPERQACGNDVPAELRE